MTWAVLMSGGCHVTGIDGSRATAGLWPADADQLRANPDELVGLMIH